MRRQKYDPYLNGAFDSLESLRSAHYFQVCLLSFVNIVWAVAFFKYNYKRAFASFRTRLLHNVKTNL
jgi:hypothetical protein